MMPIRNRNSRLVMRGGKWISGNLLVTVSGMGGTVEQTRMCLPRLFQRPRGSHSIGNTISMRLLPLSLLLLLGGCSSAPERGAITGVSTPIDPASVPNATPRIEPRCKYGNMESYKVLGKSYRPLRSAVGFSEQGIASWYGPNFDGKPTSCMERYDMYKMTAAHKTLPLPSYVEVTNLNNRKKIVVRVNDRGPFHEGRIIDLSYTAAWKLDMIKQGTAPVSIRVLEPGEGITPSQGASRYLQLGLFSKQENAEALQQKIAQRITVPVEIRTIQRDGRTLHQLLIQQQPDRFPIQTIRDQLRKMGIEGVIKNR